MRNGSFAHAEDLELTGDPMVSYQRTRKKMIRAGIPVKDVDKCETILDLNKLLKKFNLSLSKLQGAAVENEPGE